MFFLSKTTIGQIEITDSAKVDTLFSEIINDSLSIVDYLVIDSNTTDSINVSGKTLVPGNAIESTVNYNARDSIVMDMRQNKAFLYGDAHVDYGTISLDAAYIEIDWTKSEVYARGTPDTTGKRDTIGLPFFKDGSDEFVSKEMRYNFNTNKGIIKQVVTQKDDGFIHGDKIKVNEKKELFIGGAVYTTCNMEHPHFAINAKKIKVVPDKVAVTGPFNLEISGVKTPVGGPFGLFPMPKEKTSGIIMPSYGSSSGTQNRGLFLQNGGYYFAISNKVDAELTGDIYTNGSWRGNLATHYNARYKYKGSASVSISKLRQGFDRVETKVPTGYKIAWKHAPEGNPRFGRFTSSVNIQSANFNRENVFSVNQAMMNNFSSSVTYQKNIGKSPFSINASLRQDQVDSVQNYTLPDFSVVMSRLQPLKKLPGKSSIWYKQIGIGYTLDAKNRVSNKQQLFLENGLPDGNNFKINEIDFLNFDSLKNLSTYGLKHNIPLTLPSFKIFKYITLTPTAQYSESWYDKRLNYTLLDSLNRFVSNEEDGFFRAYNYSTSVNLNTRLFGYLNVGRFGLQRIKQTMSPSIRYTYKPDFADQRFNQQFFQTLTDTLGVERNLNRYQGFIAGSATQGEQQTLKFNIDNMFEAKIRSRKDSTSNFKNIKLIDNFNISTGYNFASDSLNWETLRMSARITVKGITANLRSTHDLYDFKLDSTGRGFNINELSFKNGLPEPRLTGFNISINTDLNPEKRKKTMKTQSELDELELSHINAHLDDYIDFDIPWNLRIAYNVDWRKAFTKAELTLRQSIQLSGDLSLTPKWKFTFNNFGYDFAEKGMTAAQVGIIRDLHCWEMRFSYIPFGFNKGFMFDINVKSQALQALKLSKQDDKRHR